MKQGCPLGGFFWKLGTMRAGQGSMDGGRGRIRKELVIRWI